MVEGSVTKHIFLFSHFVLNKKIVSWPRIFTRLRHSKNVRPLTHDTQVSCLSPTQILKAMSYDIAFSICVGDKHDTCVSCVRGRTFLLCRRRVKIRGHETIFLLSTKCENKKICLVTDPSTIRIWGNFLWQQKFIRDRPGLYSLYPPSPLPQLSASIVFIHAPVVKWI